MDENWGPYDLGNPHKYHKSPKSVGRCEIHRMANILMQKKSEPHPQKSMFKEICPQSSGNDRNWMLKHLKQLTLGDENKKKYTNSTDSHHFPTFFACWYLVVGTQKKPPFERTPICCRNPAAARRSCSGCNDWVFSRWKYDLVVFNDDLIVFNGISMGF